MSDRDYCQCEVPGHIKAGGICMDCGGKVGHREAASKINNGGPAFPSMHKEIQGQFSHFGTREIEVWRDGMTLRDYFAAKAMQAFCTRYDDFTQLRQVAEEAYVMADIMLTVREKQS